MSLLLNKIRDYMINLINEYIEDAAHDIFHLDRVYKMANYINKSMGYEADEDVLCIVSYLHDLHRFKIKGFEKLRSSELVDTFLEDIYNELRLPLEKFDLVRLCIISTDKHSFSKGGSIDNDLPIEAKILKDADNLDALGAIGIARAFTFGQYIREPIYIPEIDINSEEYDITKKSSSIVHHFYEKLLKLEDDMITCEGKMIAKERSNYMKLYLDIFFKEFNFNE